MMQPHAAVAAVSWVLTGTRDVFPAAFGAFSRSSAPAAVAALWQGAAVALILALCLRLAPRVSAAHRFATWVAGFAVVAGLPFLPLIAHSLAGAQIAATVAPLQGATAKPWLKLDIRWGLAIAALWIAASVLRAGGLGFHLFRVRKLWKTAAPIEGASSLAVKASTGRPVEICTTGHLDRPSVIGFFVPRILIPDWLFERLTPAELEQVVLHEAEHLHRHDDWMNLFQKIALVLFPLNPALAWMDRRLCRERELACDEGVVSRTHAPRAYAACLASLAERGQQRKLERRSEALSLAAWQHRPELVCRVHSILCGKQTLRPLAARALVGIVGCGLLLVSVELARCPQVVAFVTASQPHPVYLAQLQPVAAPTAYAPQAAFGFSSGLGEIRAKAIQSASALSPATTGDEPVYHAPRRPQPVASSEVAAREATGEPREQLIKATTPSASAAATGQNFDQQYIVFAAWEQVRVAAQGARQIADYDTGAPGQPQAGATAPTPGSKAANQIMVTQLFLAVYPIAAEPAASTGAQVPSSSKHARPTAPLAESGWLVFQL